MSDSYTPDDPAAAVEFSVSFLGFELANTFSIFRGPHKAKAIQFALDCLNVDGEHQAESPLTALQIVDAFREYAREHKLPWLSFEDRIEQAVKEAKS